jgi:hypothetical protein
MEQQATGHELSALKERLKLNLKSLLFSSKEGLTDTELGREYLQLNNRAIPFDRLGYRSLYDFLKTQHDWVSITRHRTGLWLYRPVYDAESLELGILVRGQLDPKKQDREKKRQYESSRRNGAFFGATANSLSSPSSTGGRYFPPPLQNDVRRMAALANRTVPHRIQQNIEEILKREPNYTMLASKFEREYKVTHGAGLRPQEFYFNSLRELFESIKHLVVVVEPKDNDNNFAIRLNFSTHRIQQPLGPPKVSSKPTETRTIPWHQAEVPQNILVKPESLLSSLTTSKPAEVPKITPKNNLPRLHTVEKVPLTSKGPSNPLNSEGLGN